MSSAPLLSVFSIHDTLAATTMNPSYHFFTSTTWPYAQRAWIALLESSVDYEMVNVNLQDKPQEFCDYYALANPIPNARAKVPLLEVLDQRNAFLCKSLIVLQDS